MNAAGPAPRKRLKVAYGDSKVAFSVPVDAPLQDEEDRSCDVAGVDVPAGACLLRASIRVNGDLLAALYWKGRDTGRVRHGVGERDREEAHEQARR